MKTQYIFPRRRFIAVAGMAMLGYRQRPASAQGERCEVRCVGASRNVVRGDLCTPSAAKHGLYLP